MADMSMTEIAFIPYEEWSKPGAKVKRPKPCRIDFCRDDNGSVKLLEFWKVEQNDETLREVPLDDWRPLKEGHSIEGALAWLSENGYVIRGYPLDVSAKSQRRGWRAWLGEIRPVRTRNKIKTARNAVEDAVRHFLDQHPGEPTNSLIGLDFAYDW